MAELDKNRILLIRTGGTIDAEPYADPKNPPKFITPLPPKKSLIDRTVDQLPNAGNIDGLTWGFWRERRFVKDSQKFNPGDIRALANLIKNDPHHYFVLTHGTDGMAKNAAALQEALKGTDKVVAFTGAMVPLSMDGKDDPAGEKITSDGVAMLQYTLQNIESQKKPGVYVVGRNAHTKLSQFFDPKTVEKDKDSSKADLTFTVQSR